MDIDEVDVVVLTKDAAPLDDRVADAIHGQLDVRVHLHRVVGTPRESDPNRWQTIARARNVGRTLGETPWVMFVDDDVVLSERCVATLLQELRSRGLAAIAANYLREEGSSHVAMGATLFNRDVLAGFQFRWKGEMCECQCMANDLRDSSHTIEYSKVAKAEHITRANVTCCEEAREPVDRETQDSQNPIVMAAFDRSHMGLFVGQFVRRFRATGNHYPIHAVTYGLRTKDVRNLERLPGVTVHPHATTGEDICRARMSGFQTVLRKLCPKTPVAYWDAGDVLFQRPIALLWDLVNEHPKELLVVEESVDYHNNIGQKKWIRAIVDADSRAEVWDLLRGKAIVNGGFIAGKAGVLLSHFEEGYALSLGRMLGAGGGDQVVLNAVRYQREKKFKVIDDTWNYCLGGRSGKDCKVRGGEFVDLKNKRIVSVVHGNAATLHV